MHIFLMQPVSKVLPSKFDHLKKSRVSWFLGVPFAVHGHLTCMPKTTPHVADEFGFTDEDSAPGLKRHSIDVMVMIGHAVAGLNDLKSIEHELKVCYLANDSPAHATYATRKLGLDSAERDMPRVPTPQSCQQGQTDCGLMLKRHTAPCRAVEPHWATFTV